MPVDQYIGGVEHAILTFTLFKIFYESNFITKMINLKLKNLFEGLFTQGMVCHETYKDQNG